jgi:hypothetical protein
MNTTLSVPLAPRRRVARDRRRLPTVARAGEHGGVRKWRQLVRYTDDDGRRREVVTGAGFAGSMLVVDRDLSTGSDRRLLAHLAADEPAENAALICSDYLEIERGASRRCRALTDEDARAAPFAEDSCATLDPSVAEEQRDRGGRVYAIASVPGRMSIPELRWRWRETAAPATAGNVVSLREAIARIESCESLCSLTEHALARHGDDCQISSTILRAELRRVRESPIVLNRRLRKAVLASVKAHGVSMSEIAIRCGRVKRDARGNESGETSWLARRLGLLAEGGQSAPTPWIHTDVLGLIARRGLGLSPREVETP